jgi:transposase-like protein
MTETRSINLVQLIERFQDEDACRDYLEALRWPTGAQCPRCESLSVSRIYSRGLYDCNACRHQFSVTAGTIFHDTHLPLWKWFLTVYLMAESKKGISANQLKRTLGVSYKTAWYLCHRIREAMSDTGTRGPTLFGIVEVDETLIGGKRRGVGSGNTIGKTWVAGAVQRNGEIRLERIKRRDSRSLHRFIAKHTSPDTEAIYTDELAAYLGIEDHDTRHETVNHSAEEWVIGDVHVNSVEGVWSLFKRSIVGAWHKVSVKHLDAYLSELEWRFNNRRNPYLFRDTLRRILSGQTLTYSQLTT